MTHRYEFTLKGRQKLAEPYHFKASGLPNVYLLSGVHKKSHPKHGELVRVDSVPELMVAIAFRLVAKDEPLTGAEFRFLRKRMGVTQAELGDDLNVSDQTIANYEKNKTDRGPADKAIRLTFLASFLEDNAWPHEVPKELCDELRSAAVALMRPKRDQRQLRIAAGKWRSEDKDGHTSR